MCLVAIARDECRTEWHADTMLPSCDAVEAGAFCEADGECGTSNINNCPGRDSDDPVDGVGADIYRRIACAGGPLPPSPPPLPPLLPPPPPTPPLSCNDPTGDAGASCGLCLQLVPQRECPQPRPDRTSGLRSCDVAAVNELCEGSGECDTDNEVDNCRGPDGPGQPFSWRDSHADVYRVRPCFGGAALAGSTAGGSAGGAIAVALIACLLLALLCVMASLGYPVACPHKWIAFVRRSLRLDRKQMTSPPAPVIETSSSYVAPLASNDAAAAQRAAP